KVRIESSSIVIAWVRISSISVGLPYFNFCVANGLSLQIEHLPHNIEDEARRASRSARHLCQIGILIKRFQRIKRAQYLVRRALYGRLRNRKPGCDEADAAEHRSRAQDFTT